MKNVSGYLKKTNKNNNYKDTDRSVNYSGTAIKKKRLCLKCGQKFLSKGPYNRICEKCSLTNERVSASTYSVGKRLPSEPSSFDKQLYELN